MSAMPLEEIRKLPVEERLRLVEEIWDSIHDEPDAVPVPDSHRAELRRRLAAYRANPDAGDDLDTVFSRLRQSE